MQGDLAQIHVAEILLNLHQSVRTGILRLSQGDVRKGIYYKDGAIVFAHSNIKSERLGETLLRLGKITDEEFRIASIEVSDRGRRLGRSLFEKGFLSLSEVNAGVSYQLQQIVYSVFNWDHGEYEFVDRERPVYEDIMVEISTPDLLIEGVRHITNPAVVKKIMGDDDSMMVERITEGMRLTRTNLDFAEETILGSVGEQASIGRLRSLTHFSMLELGRGIYSLLLSGMIQLRSADADEKEAEKRRSTKKRKPTFTTRPMTSGTRKKTGTSAPRQLKTMSESEMRRLIAETETHFKEITDEEILGVLPDCTREEIQQAYDKQAAIFHPPLYSEERYSDLKQPLRFISERLASAYDRLLEKAALRFPFTSQSLKNAPTPAPKAEPVTNNVVTEKKPEDASITELEEKVRDDPNNVVILRLLGKARMKEGKAREGERILLHALELEPQSVENHFALAELYQTMGLRLKAFKHLNVILQLDPENSRAMELLDIKKRKPLYEISREN
jgi:Domain of unknown function (DUF4388)